MRLRACVRFTVAAFLIIGMAAVPAGAQLTAPSLPGVDELPDLPEAPDETDPIGEVLDGLVAQIGEELAELAHPNALRLLGEDAVAASVALSRATFDTSDVAVVARADLFADSLSSGATQGLTGAPLLLTNRVFLDSRVREELERLGTKSVVLLGMEAALHPIVEDRLDDLGYATTRLGGPTRIETAIELAERLRPDATKVVLARGWGDDSSQTFADALTVGPRAAENEWPVLLSRTDVLTDTLLAYLGSSDVQEVEIVGGPAAISPAVESQLEGLGLDVTRIEGANRAATAVAIADARGLPTPEGLTRVILAEGYGELPVWAPGFAAAAHGAVNGAPIVLSDRGQLPDETVEYLVSGHPETNLALIPDEELLEASPVLLCASFVDPVSCEAASLLLLAEIPEALDLLDLDPTDLEIVSDLLDLLDETVDDVDDTVDDVDDTVDDTVDDVDDTVDDTVDAIEDTL